jgi:tetratricopeptide (TPR) repeat protein
MARSSAATLVRDAMTTLETAGLVQVERTDPELEFAFRHALVQDAAYASILRRERAELHGAVANALLRLSPERADEMAADLARHFELADDLETAGEWAFRAGRQAERRSAMPEARELYDRAAAWLPDRPESSRRRVEVSLGQGRAGLYFRSFDEEISRLQQTAPAAEQLGDPRLLIELYTALAWAFHIRGDQYEGSPAARAAIDRAVELGESFGQDPIRGKPLLAKGVARLLGGRFAEASELTGEAARILEASGDLLWAFEAQTYYLWALMRLGRFDEAEVAATHMLDVADRSGSPTAAIDCQAALAMLREEREQFDEALTVARRAAEEGEAQGILVCAAFGHLVAGEVQLRRGDHASAIRSLQKSSRLARMTHAYFIENLGRASLSAARWQVGQRDAALKGWSAARDAAVGTADRYAEGEVLALRGASLAGDPGTLARGIDDLEASVRLLQDLGALPAVARASLVLADAYRVAGRDSDAEATEARGRDLRRALGLTEGVDTGSAQIQ